MSLFSSPYGHDSDEVIKAAESLGYNVIQWSKDTTARQDQDMALIFERATDGVCGGDLVLMHPTAETVKALPSILQNYLENGLEPVRVSVNIAGVAQG